MRLLTRILGALLLTGTLGVGVAGCENKGPAEDVGEEIDEGIEEVGEEIDEAQDEIEDEY